MPRLGQFLPKKERRRSKNARTRTLGGKPVDDDWPFTKVYVRRGPTWQVVAFQASEAAQP